MEITNNSTIDSVIDFANVKFGMELTKDEVSTQLRDLTFSETLNLLNSIKADDGDAFSEIINMSVEESYSDDFDYDGTWEDDCSTCKGTGWERVSSDEDERACDDCGGTGKIDEAVISEEELNENALRILGGIYNIVKIGLGFGKRKAPELASKLDKLGYKKVGGWAFTGITIASVADIALEITSWVGDLLSGETIKEIAALTWKHKLPAAAVIAALYGGKKLIDYVAGDTKEKGGTTINNYYGADEMPATESDTTRLRELAGAPKEKIINEIDPSRSPWTQNGKHPGAMDADELRNELAVFDEIRDRGDYLSPKELAQEDSLWNYLEQIDGPQVDWENESVVDEAYGTISSAAPSRATIRAGNTQNKTANRRANNIAQDQNRDAKVNARSVAGGNKQPTGTGASRAGSADPDDIHRQEIENIAARGQDQSLTNAQEIERLKQLAMGG